MTAAAADSPSQAPLTVLYLDHTAKWSGGEIALLRLLEALDRRRVTPVVALGEDGPLAERLREAGIETHILPLSGKAREVRKDSLGAGALFRHAGTLRHYLAYARQIARFARQRGAVLLHCNSLKSDLYGALAGRLARLPVLWHVRDHIDPTYLPRPAVTGFRALAKRLPTLVVTNSESTSEKLFPEGVPQQTCRAVHDGLADRELTAAAPPPLTAPGDSAAWKHDPPRIGIVGRITSWKGQHVFLEAAAKLRKAGGQDAHFVLLGAPLFGEEAYEAKLRALAEAPELSGRVAFLGFRNDVVSVLRDLDILIHASTTPEPFGQVVIEGMAEGLPVIASDGGGVREIITHGENGILTPMGDSDALAREMSGLLADPARARRIARAGYAHVRANFTAARAARQIENLYDDMLVRAGGQRSSSSGTEPPPPPPKKTAELAGTRGK